MLKAYKYSLHPTKQQQSILTNIFGHVRFAYNIALDTKKNAYSGYQTNLSRFDLSKQLKDLKDNKCQWLKEAPAQALQSVLLNLDNAYVNFFKGGGFPRFKSKHSKQSFQLPQGVKLSEDGKKVFIPKLKWVDIHLNRKFKGVIRTVTVSKTKTGKYRISILVETNQPIPEKRPVKRETTIGVDLGIKDFAITSDGKKFENQGFLKSELKKLRVEQRSLARKIRGSNSWHRQRLKLALIFERITNKRSDHHHKLSKWIIDTYDTICIEDLAVVNMLKNHRLSKSISDVSWSEFVKMLTYKAEWYGKNVVKIGRFEPSSKTCSNCGFLKQDLTLGDRVWTCESCGESHDRDLNAAKNIKNMGLKKLSRIEAGQVRSDVSVKVGQ